MAVTVTINDRDVAGSRYVRQVRMAFSGTYSAGGEAPTVGFLRALEFTTKVTSYNPQGPGIGNGGGAGLGIQSDYDRVNNKVLLYRTDQVDDFLEELPAATSLTNVVCEAEIKGI
jgi:hypothetical protein